MKTLLHKSINGFPLMEVKNNSGCYHDNIEECFTETNLKYAKISEQEFRLDTLIKSYICYYGLDKGVDILIERKII